MYKNIYANKINKALKEIINFLPEIPKLTIDIIEDKSKTIPEIGISGSYDKEKNIISIYLDPTHSNIQQNNEKEILKTLSHEYIHATREQKIAWENCTLLEAFVSEGLAQSFEFERSKEKPIYASVLSENEIQTIWDSAQPLLNNRDFDYNFWFFNSNENNKKWIGYSIGFWLAQKHLNRLNKKSHELVFERAEEFLI